MAELRIHTNPPNSLAALSRVMGSEITVGGQVLEGVCDVVLDAPIDGVWTLRLELHVDPATLFVSKPRQDKR